MSMNARLGYSKIAIVSVALCGLGGIANAESYIANDWTDNTSDSKDVDAIYIGNASTTISGVTLEDGATWTSGGELWVDRTINLPPADPTYGYLQLNAGSSLTTHGRSYIGWNTNKRGVVQVSEGARWETTDAIQVGTTSGSSLALPSQLAVYGEFSSSSYVLAGSGGGGYARVDVQGPNATFTQSGFSSLDIGTGGGKGELYVTDRGRLNTYFLNIGFDTDLSETIPARGTVTVEGNDYWIGLGEDPTSTLNADGYISVGEYEGQGELLVKAYGRARSGSDIYLGRSGGTGKLTVEAGGQVVVGNEYTYLPSKIESWAGSTVDVTAGGRILIGGGDIESVTDGTIEVGPHGLLAGTGTIKGNVFVNGGDVNPGHSPGKLTIDGDLTLSAASTFTIEIGGDGSGQYDQLDVLGSIQFAGVLNLVFVNGFAPSAGTSLDLALFSAGIAIGGSFNGVTFGGLPAGLALDFDPDALSSGQLSAEVVPVPEPVALSLVGFSAVTLLRRRRSA